MKVRPGLSFGLLKNFISYFMYCIMPSQVIMLGNFRAFYL